MRIFYRKDVLLLKAIKEINAIKAIKAIKVLKTNRSNIVPVMVTALVAASVLLFVLVKHPITGVADNGDFGRVMGSVGLYYLTDDYNERYFGYVNRLYGIGISIPFAGGYITTQLLPVALAVTLCRLTGADVFDIRWLSCIYIFQYILAFILIAGSLFMLFSNKQIGLHKGDRNVSIKPMSLSRSWRILLGYTVSIILLLVVFIDIGYIAYFNSFYGEAVTLVFLLLMTASMLYISVSRKPSITMVLIFFISMFMFAGAKVQNSPAGILAALFGLRLAGLSEDKNWKKLVKVMSAAVVAVSLLTYFSVSKEIKICNKYQTVFYGILKDSPDPRKDLLELGLNPEYSVLAGTNYFMESYPIDIRSDSFKKEIDLKINHLKIAVFYLKHTDRLLSKLSVASGRAFSVRQGFGNFEKYPGVQYKKTADFLDYWSTFRENIFPHKFWFINFFFVFVLFIIGREYLRRGNPAGSKEQMQPNCSVNTRSEMFYMPGKLLPEYGFLIIVISATQFVMPIIGDGEADLSKHLFLFNLSFDILICMVFVYLIKKLSSTIYFLKK